MFGGDGKGIRRWFGMMLLLGWSLVAHDECWYDCWWLMMNVGAVVGFFYKWL